MTNGILGTRAATSSERGVRPRAFRVDGDLEGDRMRIVYRRAGDQESDGGRDVPSKLRDREWSALGACLGHGLADNSGYGRSLPDTPRL
jgi:hypothetical protein